MNALIEEEQEESTSNEHSEFNSNQSKGNIDEAPHGISRLPTTKSIKK